MNPLLQEQRTVLLVSDEKQFENRVRTACRGIANVVVHVSEATGVVDQIDDEVGVIVVDETIGNPVALRRSIAAADEYLPTVVEPSDLDRETLIELSAFEPTTFLRTPESTAHIETVLGDALDTYREQLVVSEEHDMFESLLSEMETPIFVKDEQGRHLRMTEVPGGVDQSVVFGKTDLEIYGYDSAAAEQFYADDMQVIEDQEPIRGKDEPSGPEQNKHWARVYKEPWFDDDGQTKGLIGLSVDVTDLKEQTERADQLEDRLEQFASYVSHDLQNPLQVASGHAQIARETGDGEPLETVLDALDRVNEMVHDLDHLARRPPEGGVADFVEIPFIARQVWNFVGGDDAELVVEASETARIHASIEELRPLLENLLRNAVVHGGEDVTVRIGTLDNGFYVADDGPGIPADERETVLQRGYTTSDDGSGTGLAIVHELIERNGWTLDIVESDAGGARFEISDALVVPDPNIREQSTEPLGLSTVGTVPADSEATASGAEVGRNGWTVESIAGDAVSGRSFGYAHTAVSGSVRIQCHVDRVEHVNDFSGAGLLLRDGLDRDDPFGFIGRTVGGDTELLTYRDHSVEPFEILLDDHSFEWFRIDRADDTCTYSVSRDGSDWEPLEQQTVSLTDPVTVGIAVYSAVPGEPCRASFDAVEVQKIE